MKLSIKHLVAYSISVFLFASMSIAQTLTIGEVYDLDVGDELHFTTWYWRHVDKVEGTKKHKVIQKKDLADSLYYQIEEITDQNPGIHLDIYIPKSQLSFTFGDTGSFFYTHWQADRPKAIFRISRDTLAGGVIVDKYESVDSFATTGGDSVILEGTSYADYFAQGLGQVGTRYSHMMGGGGTELVYYKKGSKTWGTPLKLDAIKISNIDVYPNPVHRTLHIRIDQSLCKYRLYDCSGKCLNEGRIDSNTTLDMRRYQNGLYLLKISDLAEQSVIYKRIQLVR